MRTNAMRSVSRLGLGAAALCVAAALMQPASAVPVFARKYGFNCTMCHSAFPRLNDFGLRYRRNGYRIPGRENLEKLVYETPTPLAMRTSVGYNSETFSNTPETTNVAEFQLNGLDMLSAGLLGRNIGYFMVYTPQIAAGRGVAGQDGALEAANVVLSSPRSTWFYARLGRFEPAYVPFSVKRSLTVASYEIYDFAFPGGPPFADTRTGVEITGWGDPGIRYAAGLIDGSDTNSASDSPADMYLRLEKVIGAGEGQTAGHRIGLTGYRGLARPESGASPRKSFTRVGADASMNVGIWNLGVQYLHGEDNRELWGTAENVKFDGGFAELLCHPRTDLVAFARYDWVDTPSSVRMGVNRWTVGGRYYLEDSVAVHLEYSHRTQSPIQTGLGHATERLFTARVDFAL
ncbi:MAG: hypothetical protein GX446_07430 [Chthonomonadales bacterium]|nr:hypothetical protein [Chthonomonadales bacterium]